MKKFQVNGHITVSCWTEVEAETKEQAIHIAASRHVAEVNVDGGSPIDECWHIDSDGDPTNFEAEEKP